MVGCSRAIKTIFDSYCSTHLGALSTHACSARCAVPSINRKRVFDVNTATMAPPPHVIAVGDPGTGKSTILNALCGTVKFNSGTTGGMGLTTVLQSHIVEGIRYSDTPGLDTLKKKRDAAEEIAEAIKLGGDTKLLFVIKTDAGRIRPSNLLTIRIVLHALAKEQIEVTGKYSVIINMMSKGELETWGDPSTNGREVLRGELGLTYTVDQLLCFEEIPALKDQKNKLMDQACRQTLKGFMQQMRSIRIEEGTVVKLEVDNVVALLGELEEELLSKRRLLAALARRTVNDGIDATIDVASSVGRGAAAGAGVALGAAAAAAPWLLL